jgi:hypothetical protein
MQVVADPNEPVRIPSEEELSDLSTAMALQRQLGDAQDEADEGEANLPKSVVPTMAPPVESDREHAKSTVTTKVDTKPTSTPELSVERTTAAEMKTNDPFPATAAAPSAPPAEVLKAKAVEVLAQGGFVDPELVATVIHKHTAADGSVNLDACIVELTALADLEWDEMLDDLAEMGFESDRELNKKLLIQNAGSINQTVKSLVQLTNKPRI